ncbi:ParB/RepB/Spo0J family partition protein [Micromonospora tulbaghiae]|uniref:Chromosome segregation DNA-binding protein n=1 Tax=Micromonospora tulbaghiae TaxID=479978 RepID=A0AAW4JQY7_9ACTN|nr:MULTISPECIES: ParB/RepB/Spo0J family partition protein [Micromonospora]KAB1907167.1 ParB/RepB/Spo0J family partition protein [Micromonospora sp. AMSO1212t]MBO4142455.1 ParB/RepB/Spo0J family partition protein [Micromonospora tulbaghiae]SCE64098.1 chromosome segregation DNA-binding protein [Micromonospora tulbaghiae]
MKNRPRGGLGRGLGALIPTGPVPGAEPAAAEPESSAAAASPSAPVAGATAAITGGVGSTPLPAVEPEPQLSPVPGARFAEIPVDAIVPNPKQPRHVFDEEALEELKTSIQEVGFLQPIVVRQLDPEKFELVMGERRWRAAQAVGRETIPAIVRDTKDDAMLRDALLENIHRANLNPLEEAAAYQQLLEEFGATHEELARRIGRSRPQISNTIRLMNLPPAVQRRVAAGVLSAGHARALLSLDNAEAQEALAERIVREGITVRGAEELVHLALAEEPAKSAAAKRRPKPHAPALTDLADRLSDRFDTRVKVDIGRSKGKITIEFATVDDLERIVGIIGVGEDGQPQA